MINFHGDDVTPSAPKEALFHVIPVPYEASVSYGGGTAQGPQAILEASCQLELYDGRGVPAEKGIYTAEAIKCEGATCRKQVWEGIAQAVNKAISCKSIPVVLGGEHSITSATVEALAAHYPNGTLGVVQFDAHADLRDSYEGSIWSHASVMKRIHDMGIPIFQIATRSYSLEERSLRIKDKIPYVDGASIAAHGERAVQLPADFPEHIFITFDIDALDGAIMPATGTPVPGGLSWYSAQWLLARICSERQCVGFDVVEFAPIDGFHAYDFAAAQLVYNLMGYVSGEADKLD